MAAWIPSTRQLVLGANAETCAARDTAAAEGCDPDACMAVESASVTAFSSLLIRSTPHAWKHGSAQMVRKVDRKASMVMLL